MAPNPRRQDARLETLYAELPSIDCQGLCHDSCGPIEMSLREMRRIEEAAGPVTCSNLTCSMLTAENRCAVYDIRPMICRLWGLIESMKCPYGCIPEGGWLSDLKGAEMLARADLIGGDPGGRERRLTDRLEQAANADLESQVRKFMRHNTIAPSLAGRRPTGLERDGLDPRRTSR